MMKCKGTLVLSTAVLCALASACTSEPSNGGGAGSSAPPAGGTPGGAGMSAPSAGTMGGPAGMTGGGAGMSAAGASGGAAPAGACMNTGTPLMDCPMMPPLTGACSQNGPCCQRTSNKLKEMALGPNDPLVLEYRVQFSLTTNHPLSLGIPLLTNAAIARYEKEQQSTLWRITLPRENGMEVAGMGTFEIGTGRYNCDGTYSYYSDTAAPMRPYSSDAARWAPRKVMVKVDPSKTGVDRIQPLFSDPAANHLTYTPFLVDPQVTLDFELLNQGFTMTQAEFSDAGRDCLGTRNKRLWDYGGEFVIYTPLEGNDEQPVHIVSQTYCQLVAFNVLPDGMKDLRCMTTPRCMPDGGEVGDGSCPWVKLPDSLCPTTDADKANWKCHLGVKTNVNMEEGYPADVPCTMEAPTGPLDPAAGATSTGQCCDPLGDADAANTLPACNAYRLVQKFTAAAAEITDDPKSELQPNCLTRM